MYVGEGEWGDGGLGGHEGASLRMDGSLGWRVVRACGQPTRALGQTGEQAVGGLGHVTHITTTSRTKRCCRYCGPDVFLRECVFCTLEQFTPIGTKNQLQFTSALLFALNTRPKQAATLIRVAPRAHKDLSPLAPHR